MGKLVLVPTPIGNLSDMTPRAIAALEQAALIYCEDTRTTGQLLKHLGIKAKGGLRSFHLHNEHATVQSLLLALGPVDGDDDESTDTPAPFVALVSDAGTPSISDPGFLAVREAIRAGHEVEALPGPCALILALCVSGLPTDRFCFEGFLPPKKGRQTRLRELATESRTMVFYEGPHKVPRTLADLADTFGAERPAALCRELTKLYEQTIRGTLGALAAHVAATPPRGECVLVVAGLSAKPSAGAGLP